MTQYPHHDEQDGYGCLTAHDSDLPQITDHPGRRHHCVCGRAWVLKEVAGFVVWQPDEATKACGLCYSIQCGHYISGNEHAVLMRPRSGGIGPDHLLIVPRVHVERYDSNPYITSLASYYAAEVAPLHFSDFNVIVNAGAAAGQTAMHLHIHITGRRFGDNVTMPWPDKRPSVTEEQS